MVKVKLTAASLPEVGDGAELGVDGTAAEPALVELGHRVGGVLLGAELERE